MKKGILIVILGVLLFVNPCVRAEDDIFSVESSVSTQSSFMYKINPDSVTVAIIAGAMERASGGGGGVGARKNLALPVKNPSTGKIYTITVIGCSDPTKHLTMKGTITPNIVRIEDFALKHPYCAFIEMDEDTELEYCGAEAFSAYLSTLKIAENGVLNYQRYSIDRLELGEGAELRVNNNRNFDPANICALFNFSGTTTMTIYNHSKTPQKIQSDVLDNPIFFKNEENYKSSTLYVPVGCVEVYRDDPEWSKFENILEFDSKESLAGIGDVKDDAPDNFIVSAESGRIVLETDTSEFVGIYSLQGLLIEQKSLAPGRIEIPVQKGLYIVKPASGPAKKILVP